MPDQHRYLRSALVAVGLLALSACSDAVAPELTDPRLFVTASVGGQHTCAITVDGTLLCWGYNNFGQLGDGTTTDRKVPTPVADSASFSVVSAGSDHTCALTPEGVAYCWGRNGSGQLGIGSDEGLEIHPTPVNTEARFTSISAGTSHTCAIDTEGKAHCWGMNEFGALGVQGVGDCYYPCTRSPVEVDGGLRFTSVSVGSNHTCAVAVDGSIHCWGDNEFGQLGVSTSELCEREHHDPHLCSTTPVSVSGGTSWKDVSVGRWHTCALATNGRAHCWGHRLTGVLGDGIEPDDSDEFRTEPAPVVGGLIFTGMSSGSHRTCAISTQGPTYCWGEGHLGDGTGEDSSVPVPVATKARFHVVAVGFTHACGVSIGGVMYCWGENWHGQLGDGSHAQGWATPVVVRGW